MAERADASRNRKRLLHAAAQVFAERGMGATMNAIAERAGLTKMTVYRHYASKEDLLLAIMVEHYDQLTRVAEDILRRPMTPVTALESYAEAAVARLSPDRAYFHFALMAGGVSEALKQSAGRLDSAVSRLLERAQDDGAIHPDVTAGDVHSLLVAISASLGDRQMRYFTVLLAGLAAGPVAEPPMRFEDFGRFQSEQARRRSARNPAT